MDNQFGVQTRYTDTKVMVCRAVRRYKSLWKSAASSNSCHKKKVQEAWRRVAGQTGIEVCKCKEEFNKAKAMLKRRVETAIAKNNATTWQQIDKVVEEAPSSNWKFPFIWNELLWLAEDIAKTILKKRTNGRRVRLELDENLDFSKAKFKKLCNGSNATFVMLPNDTQYSVSETQTPAATDSNNTRKRKSKGQSGAGLSAKKRKLNATKNLRSMDSDFKLVLKTAADETHPVDGPTSMIDIKYSVTVEDQDVQNQNQSWGAIGPPIDAPFDNGSAQEEEYFGSSHPTVETSQQFFGDQLPPEHSSSSNPDLAVYSEMVQRNYLENLGNVSAATVEKIIDKLKRCCNFE